MRHATNVKGKSRKSTKTLHNFPKEQNKAKDTKPSAYKSSRASISIFSNKDLQNWQKLQQSQTLQEMQKAKVAKVPKVSTSCKSAKQSKRLQTKRI